MSKKTVLIVDDSKVSRMMISALITDIDGDIEQIQAESGDNALEVVKNHNVDYFSVDLNMPGMDGFELIEKLLPDYPDAKFSLLTANIQEGTRLHCEKLGIKFTEKPVTDSSIKSMMEYFNG